MTEQEWDERDYNQQRGKGFCPLFAVAIIGALVGLVVLLFGGRR